MVQEVSFIVCEHDVSLCSANYESVIWVPSVTCVIFRHDTGGCAFALHNKLVLHLFEAIHAIVYFDPSIDSRTSKCNNELSWYVSVRHLERASDCWVLYSNINSCQNFKHIVLPQKHTPIRISTKSDHMALVILRAKCSWEELFCFVLNFLLGLWNNFLSLASLKIVNCTLCSLLSFFADCEEAVCWRDCYEINAFSALTARYKKLAIFLNIEDNHIMAWYVE